MIKKVIITLTDRQTGEILGSNKDSSRYLPIDRVDVVSRNWLDSLMRGVRQGRELSLTITIRDKVDSYLTQQDLF